MQVVLDKCFRFMRTKARQQHTGCIFSVPDFILGHSSYDLNACVRFVWDRLLQQGFVVSYVHPRTLLISWDMANTKQGRSSASKGRTLVPSRLATLPRTPQQQQQQQQQLLGPTGPLPYLPDAMVQSAPPPTHLVAKKITEMRFGKFSLDVQ